MLYKLLKKHWGYDAFRPLQEDIISSVLQRHDTLAIMPTGGGKSLCFQVPTLAMDGLCVVVSPLIALMKDQVEQLKKRQISAIAIYSGMSKHEIDVALDNCIYGNVKFLYCSPERLQTTLFKERVKQMKVCLLAIDEAHCVSQWGYDFRPPYMQIVELRSLLPNVPLIALTATATPEVKADIQDKLGMKNVAVFQQSFARKNLSYSALLEENKEKKLLTILQRISAGAVVVYVRNRRRTQELAQWLLRCGVSATYYHAGLTMKDRHQRQADWIENRVRVMVATNAFGMGIDKPDVRVVVHLDLPDTLEAYYQEAGRAGRDEQKAYAVALYNQADIENLTKQVEQAYPALDRIRHVYQCLANYYQLAIGSGEMASFDFEISEFVKRYDLSVNEVFHVLKNLETEGFLQLNEGIYTPSKLMFLIDNRALYEFQVANARYDKFTKILLRMYGGGIFTNHSTISEGEIAKHFMAPPSEVEHLLKLLTQSGIIDYQPRKEKPQLTFLMPRQDAKTLRFDTNGMQLRYERAKKKAQAVARYMQHPHRCRTQLLLAYFGEHTQQTCGICDNCVAQQKKGISNEGMIAAYRNKVLEYLRVNDGMSPAMLVQYIKPIDEKVFANVLRAMLADDEIAYNSLGNLSLIV
jgi:ATP-dependent DNA helicase RecQ